MLFRKQPDYHVPLPKPIGLEAGPTITLKSAFDEVCFVV
jgi:hypothetical protein